MTKILYITSKSIYTCAAQSTLIDIIAAQKEHGNDVGVLLIQDSTLACWKGAENIISDATDMGIKIYAIKEDLEARGIIGDKANSKIKQVNYDEAITVIMDKYEKVITWC